MCVYMQLFYVKYSVRVFVGDLESKSGSVHVNIICPNLCVEGVLPLKGLGSTIRTVAVVGPNADNIHSHIGLYCDSNPRNGIVTVLNATIAAANASGNRRLLLCLKCSL